jgi:hypothetical protein
MMDIKLNLFFILININIKQITMVTCKTCKKNFHKKKATNMAQHDGKCSKCQKIKPQSRRAFVKEQKEKLLKKWLEKSLDPAVSMQKQEMYLIAACNLIR